MTDAQFLRRPEEEESPPRRAEADTAEPQTTRPLPDDRLPESERPSVRPLTVPAPRLRYASPDLERFQNVEVVDDRVQAITRTALESLGSPEERALRLTPEDEVLTRLLGDESIDLQLRSDQTPLIPEDRSRALSSVSREEGLTAEEDYRREAELKPEDLEETQRERRELVREFYAGQGHELVNPAEIAQLVGPPTPETTEPGTGAETAAGKNPAPQTASPLEDLTAQSQARAARTASVLKTEGGERALRAVTERLSLRFHEWLRREGLWHKRSEWLKKQLSRSWEFAPDALNPHTLLLAPKGRGRLSSYVQADVPDAELQNDKLPEKDRAARKAALGKRTREAAKSNRFERQIREARRAAVLAVTKTISKNWAESRDPAWHLDALQDDASAPIKSPQNQGLGAWLDL